MEVEKFRRPVLFRFRYFPNFWSSFACEIYTVLYCKKESKCEGQSVKELCQVLSNTYCTANFHINLYTLYLGSQFQENNKRSSDQILSVYCHKMHIERYIAILLVVILFQ